MITWHDEITFDFSETMTDQLFTEQAVFFDIETTGFSPARSSLYLIGCATRKADTLFLDQFFAESADEEKIVINAFFQLLIKYDTIITFNGIGFDIPYLKAKCASLHISSPFDHYTYLDIYKEISSLKALLGLTSLKQKSIELFLGIDRKDLFNGGDLIKVYKDYTKHPSKEALTLLRQHNYEDVLHMPKLLTILSYRKTLTGELTVIGLKANESRTLDGSMQKELIFSLSGVYVVPKPLSYHFEDCYLSLHDSTILLCVKLFDGELRFFLDNPKEYYYLPDEDMAIHKSLATGVERKHRRQANASNCYVHKHAIFLPQYEKLFTPAFRQNLRDRKSYFELSDDFISSSVLQERYVKHLLKHIKRIKNQPC